MRKPITHDTTFYSIYKILYSYRYMLFTHLLYFYSTPCTRSLSQIENSPKVKTLPKINIACITLMITLHNNNDDYDDKIRINCVFNWRIPALCVTTCIGTHECELLYGFIKQIRGFAFEFRRAAKTAGLYTPVPPVSMFI